MKTLNAITMLLVILTIGCQSHQMDDKSTSAKVVVPANDLDTAQALADMNIVESFNRTELIEKDNKKELKDQIDTLDLTYHFGFCDCQHWIISEIYGKARYHYPDIADYDLRGGIDFNLTKHGFYIEPADQDLALDMAEYNGNRIRLIGREYEKLGLPNTDRFTVPDPPKGRIFRYYAYELIRPFTVWGPQVIVEIDNETGDTLTAAAQLTVK